VRPVTQPLALDAELIVDWRQDLQQASSKPRRLVFSSVRM
jgi:hypothetical protein